MTKGGTGGYPLQVTTNPPPLGPLAILAFLCEIVMLVLLATAGHDFGGVVFAVVFPVVAIGVWAVWMAPTSRRRLRNPRRLAAQGALFVCTAGLYGGQRPLWVGIAFAIVAFGVFSMRSKIDP